MLTRIRHLRFDNATVWDVAISGDKMAVACGDKGLLLFDLSREIIF